MASVSSTSSLGNTSLRGFGGMVSGIDRDEIIEQMTLGTTTKISNAEKDITKLEWKQEAFRSISDKIIGLSDDYFSFSSPSSLVDPTIFAKNLITVHGSEKSSKYVTASGTSDLVGNVSVKEVRNLASAAVLKSDAHVDGALQTSLNNFTDTKLESSKLKDTYLTFGIYDNKNGWSNEVKLKFNSSYTEKDPVTNEEKTKTIEYIFREQKAGETDDEYAAEKNKFYNTLAEDLNKMIDQQDLGDLKGKIKFKYSETNKALELDVDSSVKDYELNRVGSSAAGVLLGLSNDDAKNIKLEDINKNTAGNVDKLVSRMNALEGLMNKEVTFNYNGSQKKIALLTKDEVADIKKLQDQTPPASAEEQMEVMRAGLQERLDRAYGQGKVLAELDTNGNLTFKTSDQSSGVSITSGDDDVLRCLGISYGASSKVSLSGSLSQNQDKFGLAAGENVDDWTEEDLRLEINGVQIGGITKDTSISDILSKINKSNAGVKATYVEATGQFMLVSSETGEKREIKVGDTNGQSKLEEALFGYGKVSDEKLKGASVDGKDATIVVSYGNGVDVELKRSSNSFNLEGLTVTVSGVFGGEYKKDADGNVTDEWISDSSDTVTFTAKADVDKATERVKSFFEAFNELVEEVNGQLTTRPDSDYGPLTDEQKEEMSETSIENWEKKAKQGILFGDSSIRDLSSDIQGIFTKLMNDGASYDDLNKIGITYSSDYKDGGKLVFDEAKFRAAMESEPELVSKIFTGGDGVGKGLTKIMEKTFTPYATRYASDNAVSYGQRGSYGRLIEEAGSEKAPTTLFNNFIYNQIKDIQNRITSLRSQLVTQQDRYIKQFSTMETLISQMNSQSSWLSQITG